MKRAITYEIANPPADKSEDSNGHAMIRAMEWYLPFCTLAFACEDVDEQCRLLQAEIESKSAAELACLAIDLSSLSKSLEMIGMKITLEAAGKSGNIFTGPPQKEIDEFRKQQFARLYHTQKENAK